MYVCWGTEYTDFSFVEIVDKALAEIVKETEGVCARARVAQCDVNGVDAHYAAYACQHTHTHDP